MDFCYKATYRAIDDDKPKDEFNYEKIDYIVPKEGRYFYPSTYIQETMCDFLEDTTAYMQHHELSKYDYRCKNGQPIVKYFALLEDTKGNLYKVLDEVSKDNHAARAKRKADKKKRTK